MATRTIDIRKKKITQLAATVPESQSDLGMIETPVGANHAAPHVLDRSIHHIEVPGNDAPLVGRRLVIEVIVGGITEIDIPSGPVDGTEAIVALKVKILTPPSNGVEISTGGVKGIPIRRILQLGGALILFV